MLRPAVFAQCNRETQPNPSSDTITAISGDSSEGGAGSSAVTPMSRAQRDFVVVLERCEKFPVALAVESDYGHDDPSHYR